MNRFQKIGAGVRATSLACCLALVTASGTTVWAQTKQFSRASSPLKGLADEMVARERQQRTVNYYAGGDCSTLIEAKGINCVAISEVTGTSDTIHVVLDRDCVRADACFGGKQVIARSVTVTSPTPANVKLYTTRVETLVSALPSLSLEGLASGKLVQSMFVSIDSYAAAAVDGIGFKFRISGRSLLTKDRLRTRTFSEFHEIAPIAYSDAGGGSDDKCERIADDLHANLSRADEIGDEVIDWAVPRLLKTVAVFYGDPITKLVGVWGGDVGAWQIKHYNIPLLTTRITPTATYYSSWGACAALEAMKGAADGQPDDSDIPSLIVQPPDEGGMAQRMCAICLEFDYVEGVAVETADGYDIPAGGVQCVKWGLQSC